MNRAVTLPSLAPVLRLAPGLALAVGVAVAARGLATVEAWLFGQAWVSDLVLALLIGSLIHLAYGLPERLKPGATFGAKTLLEIAIVLLGATMNLAVMGQQEFALAGLVAGFVVAAVAIGYVIGRALGLEPRLAALVACGNAICGNSAILAAAPVIRAKAHEIAAALAFTALIGLGTVLVLPLIRALIGMQDISYGILAGLTVYAVPQVLAAASAGGAVSVQVGAMVKLMRVLMLGPVIIALGLASGRGAPAGDRPRLVPAFIIGFVALAALRAFGLIPEVLITPMGEASEVLSLVAMAALGLVVNLRTVGHAGGRVLAAGVLSLTALALMSGLVLFVLDHLGTIG
ncbi:UPF0324 membrane protein [Agaricicola taiwanensis]|uniref:UPF0324 membrane protein n=1 Tax=Agaricicola taiwanensis TaxID=591372 RepID=A0A8J2YMA9_9RHOB|nr:putative sulfate exporter family transporter [Agaricicola taiwanensis]GGE53201.1 UPF0324 membrane protein [Agaricicola taiwanensis]